MEIRKRVLGAEHPDALTSINNLALTYLNQGRWKEAKELDVQVMETSNRILGAEHPDTLTSMANLASTYGNQGRSKEAEKLDNQVIDGIPCARSINTNIKKSTKITICLYYTTTLPLVPSN